MKKMKLAFAALTFAVAGVANATVVTMSMSGRINVGDDFLGLFGTTRNLNGRPATLTISVEYDAPYQYVTNPGKAYLVGTHESFNVAVDLAGTTYKFSFADAANSTVLLSASGGVRLHSTAIDAFGRPVRFDEFMSQPLHAVSLTDYQYIPLRDSSVLREAAFSVGTGTGSYTSFDIVNSNAVILNGDPVTLPPPEPILDPLPVPGPASVPEPASAMLFGVGLLGLATLRHRRRLR